MKLNEIGNLRNIINTESSVIVNQNNTTFILGDSWDVSVEAPDGHFYKLKKQNWNAVDLIEFILQFPFEDDQSTLLFTYNVPGFFETSCLFPTEVMAYFEEGEYDLEFSAQ